jgi:hypothetical protein
LGPAQTSGSSLALENTPSLTKKLALLTIPHNFSNYQRPFTFPELEHSNLLQVRQFSLSVILARALELTDAKVVAKLKLIDAWLAMTSDELLV